MITVTHSTFEVQVIQYWSIWINIRTYIGIQVRISDQ